MNFNLAQGSPNKQTVLLINQNCVRFLLKVYSSYRGLASYQIVPVALFGRLAVGNFTNISREKQIVIRVWGKKIICVCYCVLYMGQEVGQIWALGTPGWEVCVYICMCVYL